MVVDGLKEAAVCPVPFHHSRDAAEIPSRQVPPLHTTLPRSSAGCPPNPRRRRRKRGHFPLKTLRRRVTAGREESSRLSEDPVTVAFTSSRAGEAPCYGTRLRLLRIGKGSCRGRVSRRSANASRRDTNSRIQHTRARESLPSFRRVGPRRSLHQRLTQSQYQ